MSQNIVVLSRTDSKLFEHGAIYVKLREVSPRKENAWKVFFYMGEPDLTVPVDASIACEKP